MIHRIVSFLLLVLIGLVYVGSRSALAAETGKPSLQSQKKIDFAKQVYPIFRRACFECHGPNKQESEFRLDRREEALDYGAIDPGNPEDSELLRRVSLPRGHEEVMPVVGKPLSKKQVAVIRRWIEQGAEWPEQIEQQKHWSYVAPRRSSLPAVSNPDWARSPIDRFVLRRLDQEGLAPSPPAAPEKLVRRLYLDLIGLPPTPAEIDAFLNNPSEARYEQLVDELLARPQFGERWARPWLDLARYADSHGFQRDNLRSVWAYRDWVIRAMNADMPFDQFTIEQIAGDLLPNATESQKIATGFHRCTPSNVEAGSLPEETRIEQVIDRVNTTGAVWLGSTLECCQCHDHKYDPFAMKEYYQLLAFYNNTKREADRTNPNTPSSIQFQGPYMSLSNQDRDSRRASLEKQLASVRQQRTERRKALDASLTEWVAQFSESSAQAPKTHALAVTRFESEGATDSFKRLEDDSILLVGGDPPDTDHYTLRVKTKLNGIRAFRLDALRHDSLPGKGPGRGDPERRNFVLQDFSVHVDQNGSSRKLKFASAKASFSQTNWNVSGTIDTDPKTGWAIAPQFDKSHWATFILSEPLDATEETELVFTLAQEYGKARTIGRLRLSALTGNIVSKAVPETIAKLAAKPVADYSKKDREKLLGYRAGRDPKTRQLTEEISKLEKQIGQLAPDTTLVMVELEKPRVSTLFNRGDYRNPGEVVRPGTPAVLHPLAEGPPNRLTLARWLVSRKNPLVARVTVNRWWAELFGEGIVTTVEDFGIKGESPSHPQLLDWLAVELMENGWSMKKLLKTIVLSSTYRQSSRVSAELLEKDDQNRLLARGPRFRMDAEMIRDNALAISGLLNLKQFGPSIRPYQPDGLWKKVGGTSYEYKISPGAEQHRRGIYVVLRRGTPYPSFTNFDMTARLACVVKRSRTNTPLQALTLLNDPVYVTAARALAKRVTTEKKDAPLGQRLAYAFQCCTARQPTESERSKLLALYKQQVAEHEKRTPKANKDAVEAAAWQAVATALLNLHETITKD